MLFKAGDIPDESGIGDKNKLSSQYYEEVGDPLAGFRKIIPGGLPYKDGKDDGWHKDPDWVQHIREKKLNDDSQTKGLSYRQF